MQGVKPLEFKGQLNEKENQILRMEFTKRFAEKLRQVRKSKGLTQSQVSELSGLHESYYGHIEICRFRPSLFVAWKIAKALGISLDELTNS